MKRFFDQNRHQLTDLEKEQVWQGIRGELKDQTTPRRARRSVLKPGLALAAVLAVAIFLRAGLDKTGFGNLMGASRHNQVELVELAIDPAETEPARQDRDPAAVPAAKDVAADRNKVEIKSAVTETGAPPPPVEQSRVLAEADALSKPVGALKQMNTPAVRGGRTEEIRRMAVQATNGLGTGGTEGNWSVTGGTKPPNGEQVELMYFEHTGVNPFVAAEDDNLSTFAIDVDNASWTLTRNYLAKGMLPPPDAIRVEEFVNAFDPGWAAQEDDVFQLHSGGAASRFGKGYHLLRVGVVGKTVSDEARLPANLIFVIDISGSMRREDRLESVKSALHVLLDELDEGDSVGLVVYGSRGEIRLEPTDISERSKIAAAIDGLMTGGSTNVHEGLDLAYAMARKNYEAGKVNRLILCSDGVANSGGSTEAEEILSLVRKASDEGVTISTIGFGMGNYNDVLMEKLADKGDGNYYYVDRPAEAQRVFRENLTGMLQTIAREVKVQVEFDPEVVDRWRLLGYENRDVADRDFRNDAVDAGEVGAGHQVTALYELKIKNLPDAELDDPRTDRQSPDIRVGTVRLRHEAPAHDTPRAGQVEEIAADIMLSSLTGDFAGAPVRLRVQAVAAEFAEILRRSFWAKESRLADLVTIADGLAAELPDDQQVRDLATMIRQAADLEDEQQ
jgi:Ca-activated chloride channel family protein